MAEEHASDSTTGNRKPRLNFFQIWNMSFGFLGIQIGFALQNANTSRIFETLGADTSNLAIYWLAAPVTGLIVQPIIGYYSDRTWHPKWGRRRPYFAIGAILSTLALLLMPNSPSLWMAVGVLWLMDASINISMEPFRAFVGDLLPNEQRTAGFAMQSFFIGIGAFGASFLPWIFANWLDIANTAPEGVIPPSVRYSFYVGAFFFLVTVLWTVFSTKEYPPEKELEQEAAMTEAESGKFGQRFLRTGSILCALGALFSVVVYLLDYDKQLHVMGGSLIFFGLAHVVAWLYVNAGSLSLPIVHIVKDFNTMPKTMSQLAIVQFFTWFALFSMWIYTTSAVTSHIYGSEDTTSALYNEGADMVGNLFGGYNGIAAIAAILLPFLARATSRKMAHLISLVAGGIGLISIYFVSEPQYLWLSMVGVGIAWASILSMPYAILSGALPADKMGYYMGVFNFFIVIPQIMAASLLGFFLTTFFDGQTIYILILGGLSMILAGFLTLFVEDKNG